MAVYSENHKKPTNTLHAQTATLLFVKAGLHIVSYHFVSKGLEQYFGTVLEMFLHECS
jgi:hypothetical protein